MKVRRVLGLLAGAVVCAAFLTAPADALAGSIAGNVKSAATGLGIEGIYVCANTANFGVSGGCDGTDSAGNYKIDGLQPSPYVVAFEQEGRKNYVAQWYPGKAIREEAQAVQVESGDVTGIDALLQVGGQISGRVTDASSGGPIEGIEICAPQLDRPGDGGTIHCTRSASDGNYTVQALATGLYKVEFGSPLYPPNGPNYIRQYYPGKSNWQEAEVRQVNAGETIVGVDAALQEGIQILGTVSEAGGAGLTWEARVCALNASTEAIVQCNFPAMDGSYWLRGLPFGSYKISFAVDVEEEPGLILHPDGFVRQYYKGKPSFEEADVLSGAGPATFTGIDAQLVRGPEVFPKRPPAPQPVVVTLIERPPVKPLRCRRSFRKKWVKGKRRCVKIHGKHRPGHRHGPRAHATGR